MKAPGQIQGQVDAILEELGPLSCYAIAQCIGLAICQFSLAFQVFAIVFVGSLHTCSTCNTLNNNLYKHIIKMEELQNGTENRAECTNGFTYFASKDSSVMSEFDLVCKRAPLLALTQTLLITGQALGSLFLPAFADRWGRKFAHLIAHALTMVSGVANAFAPNYIIFAVSKLFVGIGTVGLRLTLTTAILEHFPTRIRSRVNTLTCGIGYALCCALLPLVTYCLRFESWRNIQHAINSFSVLLFLQVLILDEPLRWLLANHKQKRALAVVRKAARWNKKKADLFEEQVNGLLSPPVAMVTDTELEATPDATAKKSSKPRARQVSFLDIMRHPQMRINCIICCLLWFVNTMTYFGLYLTSASLAGDVYLNFCLNALVEIPSCIAFFITLERYGRRPTLCIFHVVSGVALISSGVCRLFEGQAAVTVLSTVLSLMGKFGATGNLNVTLMYTAELFPTNCRNQSLGAASSAGRIGMMVAPFATLLVQYFPWAPGAIFGASSLLIVFLLLFLPETKGRELPQTVEDLEKWYHTDHDRHEESVTVS